MSPRDRWFILAASCPRCGWRPSKRVTQLHVQLVSDIPASEELDSMKCQRKGCETTYVITARAYHNARAA